MLTLIYFSFREYFSAKLKKKDVSHTDVYRSLQCWKSNRGGRKSLIISLLEADKLARYWHCFPDVYYRFGMFMKDFTDKELMKSYLPQGAYGRITADKNLNYHILIDDKILFHDIMTTYHLPVPERYFVYEAGTFRDHENILDDDHVNAILSVADGDRIYIKRFRGGAASGISIATKSPTGYVLETGEVLTAEVIRKVFGDSNYIFEKQLVQDPVLSAFNSDTVNTLRIMTYKDKVVSCSVRMGRRGSFVDNAAKGGIVCSLDMETGCLEEYGLREYDLTKYYEHPDSHLKFDGVLIPQWPAAKALVEKTIKIMPYYNSVGFDVATTVDGPVIIEINSGTGVYASQMGKKRGIADKFNRQ